MKALPTEAGYYFGRSRESMKWYDLIVYVVGEAPMLRVAHVYSRLHDKVALANAEDIFFGPEIKFPEVPKSDIKKD